MSENEPGTTDPTAGASPDPVEALTRDSTPHELGRLRYHAIPRLGYLLIRYAGQVESVKIAERWFQHIDGTLERNMLTRVLWDSRPAAGHPPAVRARIWEWLEEARVLQRSAILVESEMLRLSANLSGLSGSLSLKAFRDFDQAEQWLLR